MKSKVKRLVRFLLLPLLLGLCSEIALAGSACSTLLQSHLWPAENNSPRSAHHQFLARFGNYGIDEFTRNIFRQYPEIRYLLGEADVSAEVATAAPYEHSPSQIFAGVFRPEFDRTLLSIWVLQMLWKGGSESYEQFKTAQHHLPPALQLKPDTFTRLHQLFLSVLGTESADRLDALIAFMVAHDLGKAHDFQHQVRALSGSLSSQGSQGSQGSHQGSVQHDQVFLTALENAPQLMPGLASVSAPMHAYIQRAAAADFGVVPQFAQGEAPAADLQGLAGLGREVFDFAFLHSLLDVAGASGAKSFSGSGSMIEPVAQNYFKVYDHLVKLAESSDSLNDIYWQFHLEQAQRLNLPFARASQNPEERALARLLLSARVATEADAHKLITTFANLPLAVRALLVRELNQTGIRDGWAIKLEYTPALFVSCLGRYKKLGGENSYEQGLNAAMNALARLFGQGRKAIRSKTGSGTLNLSIRKVAEQAATMAEELSAYDFSLDELSEKEMSVKLSRRPALQMTKLPQLQLEQLPDRAALFVGMGGGSDAVQAATVAQLMRHKGKAVSAVISVRVHPGNDKVKIDNPLSNPFPDVYKIGPQTTGLVGSTGRFLEKAYARDVESYLILDREDGRLIHQLVALQKLIERDSYLIGVDSGGDSAMRVNGTTEGQGYQSTPDRDHQVLLALAAASAQLHVPSYTMTVAPGIDSPDYACEIFKSASARFFWPSPEDAEFLLSNYAKNGLDGSQAEYFGVTMFAWQAALRGAVGWTAVPVPVVNVLDMRNPWLPYARTEPATRGIVVMETQRHLAAIGVQPVPFGRHDDKEIRDFSWQTKMQKIFATNGYSQKLGSKQADWDAARGQEVVGIHFAIFNRSTTVFRGVIEGTRWDNSDSRPALLGVIKTDEGEVLEPLIDDSVSWHIYRRP